MNVEEFYEHTYFTSTSSKYGLAKKPRLRSLRYKIDNLVHDVYLWKIASNSKHHIRLCI